MIDPEESLQTALRRALGVGAVVELTGSVLSEGVAGSARAGALESLTAHVGRAVGLAITAHGETVTLAHSSASIAPDEYSSSGALGGIIEVSRALNAVLAEQGVLARVWTFFSRDETSGVCVATPTQMEAILEAVADRYGNEINEQLARYGVTGPAEQRAGFR
jgi:hypothetical protein